MANPEGNKKLTISDRRKGEWNPWNKGKKLSKEHRENIRKSNIKTYQNPKLRRRISQIKKQQYKENPSIKKRIDKTMTDWWKAHPNVREVYRKRAIDYFIKNPKWFQKFLEGGKNSSRLTEITQSGIKVRSKPEKQIADFLTSHGIKWCYECKPLFLDGWICVPDFYIHKYNLHIEYYGGYPKSLKKKIIKNKLYKKHNINMLCLRPFELKDLKKYLLRRLR